ncbi:MAG: hypothetical protein LBS16_00235 [Prevotellaceae bacterium]|jgi:predicted nuclease with TOPRIM domain|nr:hypothetical protein [Prevotellaceae bacterium]
MRKKNIILFISGLVVVAGLVIALLFSLRKMKVAEEEVAGLIEQMTYEKETLENEYNDIAYELEGFSVRIDNDSILRKLDEEQKRVQLLLEELRTTKATNTRRIAELKKELASVRQVLTYYIAQVDSLNLVNTQLQSENREVREQYHQATQTVHTLEKEKEALSEQVTIASQLEVRNIVVEQLNERGKNVSRISRTDLLKVTFTVGKNITASVGGKTVYLRIVTPDDRVLVKKETDTFLFENKNIPYSCKKQFEYGSEAVDEVLYWTVEETLLVGAYRVDIFIDQHLAGSQVFTLKK